MKTGVWIAGIAGTLLILMLVFNLMLTRTSLPETLKEALLAKISETSACKVDIEKLEISLFPTPHAVAFKLRLTFPGGISGAVESLSLTPRILPLFTGHLTVGKARFTAPRMEIRLPHLSGSDDQIPMPPADGKDVCAEDNGKTPGSTSGRQALFPVWKGYGDSGSLSGIEAAVHSLPAILAMLGEKMPGLHLQIEHGSIDLHNDTGRLILLTELSAAIVLPPGMLRMKIECQSDHWEKLALDMRVDPQKSIGSGRISVNRLQTQRLVDHMPPTGPIPVGESLVDLDLSFSRETPEMVGATLKGSTPSLTLQAGDEKAIFKNLSFEGTLSRTAERFELKAPRLTADEPRLSAAGRFVIDSKIPESSYDIQCENVNASALRQAALALAGKSEAVRDVFEIIRGGTVPRASFEAHGTRPGDLKKSESLMVNGSLQGGEVFIPKVDLTVKDVFGDVVISRDILEGKNLQGTTENSAGRNGSLTVALTKGDGPFHLDIEIDADLGRLPPVLGRVVDSGAFLKELAGMQDVAGRAKGRLILGETLKNTRARVEVGDWNLTGRYRRFPFPFELRASSFFYEGSAIAVGSLIGSLGRSQIMDVSGSLDWSRGSYLQLEPSTRAKVSLDEIFPWLMSLPGGDTNRWNIQSMEGTLWIDSLDFKGLLSRPDDWHFEGEGRIEDFTARTSLLPDTLQVKAGALSANRKNLKVKKSTGTLLDSSVTLSGKFTGYLTDLQAADLAFRGDIGPQAARWAFELLELPPDLEVRTPLSTSQTRLNWVRGAPTALSTAFSVSGGPEVSIAMKKGARALSLTPFSIKDHESDASLDISITEGEYAIGFKGNLTAGTLERLFAANRLFGGSLAGDFTAKVVPDQPSVSTADGRLKVKDLWYVPKRGTPLAVRDASLNAKGKSMAIDSAAFRLMETPMELKGGLEIADEQVQLDMDLHAEGIDWNRLKEATSIDKTSAANGENTLRNGERFQNMPIRGTLRVHAGSFTYDRYRWEPLQATILFARDGTSIQITDAGLCTIPTPATIIPSNMGTLLVLKVDGRGLDLDPTLSCLWDRKGVITGTFNLDGEITARLQEPNMAETVQGMLNLTAWNGRVYRSTILAKIFDLLNFTEIYRGRLPDLANEGCAYDSIKARASVKNGKILVDDLIFDGRCAKMVWTGEIDPVSRKIDFTVLISPLKTVDTVIRNIPLVGRLLGGSLISIPVRVSGDISDPSVRPLAPTAVGSGLLGTMKRVFQLPFELTQPLQFK